MRQDLWPVDPHSGHPVKRHSRWSEARFNLCMMLVPAGVLAAGVIFAYLLAKGLGLV